MGIESKERIKVHLTWLMPKGFCLNLFGSLWARDDSWIDPCVINHERIHTAQMRELLWIPFYILYGLEWTWRFITLRDWYKAYRAVSFEREAYTYGDNLSYLSRRRHFTQWRRKKT